MKPGQRDEALAPQPDGQAASEPPDRFDALALPAQEKKVLRSALDEVQARSAGGSSGDSGQRSAPKFGLTLLFAGEAGTGKTFAAELLAEELGVGIVGLDLGALASQDPGDAENQIAGAFAEADPSGALVVLDRADALVDTASAVPAPRVRRPHHHGRPFGLPALVERSHRYPGAVVFMSRISPKLAPSLPTGMDFVVEFPFPWSDGRKQIWRRLLPDDARVDDDELEYLAVSFMDTGATIRDCCVAATAAAAAEGVPVGMAHIAHALQDEYRKRPASHRASTALARLLEGDAVAAPAKPTVAPAKPAAKPTPRGPAVEPTPRGPAVEPTPRKPAPEPASGTRDVKLTPYRPAIAPDPPVPAPEPLQARIEAALGHPTRPPAEPSSEPAPSGAAPAASGAAPTKPKLVPATPALVPSKPDESPGQPASRPAGPVPVGDKPTVVQRARLVVPAPAPARERRSVSNVVVGLALAGIVLAAVLGFLLARSTGGSSSPAAPSERLASAGPIQVSYPSTWRQRALPPATARGLSDGLAVGPAPPARGLLVIGTSSAANSSRLSQPLRAVVAQKTPANVVAVGGVPFNVYPSVPGVRGVVYAVPTTAGTVFATCMTDGAAPGFGHSCERVLATLRLTSGRFVPPGQSAGYASAVSRAMGTLNAARSKAASQLRAARTGQAQAAAADKLAAAHAAAASSLVGLTSVGPAAAANAAVVTALRTTADAYRALSRAATDNDAAAYATASSAVTRAQSSLQSALARLRNLGYQVG